MAKSPYPTGVENHGGNLRIWFIYKGVRVRESLGVVDTPKNRRTAGDLRAAICYGIKTGSFDYAVQFPESQNLKRFGHARREINLAELSEKWLELKSLEITANALSRYRSIVRNMLPRMGGNRMASAVTQEELLFIRRDLLTGYHTLKMGMQTPTKGRSARTVNNYMLIMSFIFEFAKDSGYIDRNPFDGIDPLKKSKTPPDPLTRDEFSRLIDGCHNQQIKNFWSLAVYTGLRHGELCALAWEDIDLRQGTLMVRRNHTLTKEFTLPKTDAGTDRVVYLIDPAIQVLKNQAEMTRLGRQYQVEVKMREYGRTTTHPCTFVFNPQISTANGRAGHHYAVGSVAQSWEAAMKRAGLRYRRAYQSRHTYACWSLTAGANPSFIATQMGHANAQMVYQVYGAWMSDNSSDQIAILNQKLSDFAPPMPHPKGSAA